MSAELTRLLQTMGGSLMGGRLLTPGEDYQQKTALMLGLVLVIAGEESDRLVDRLVEENAAQRALFRDAAALVEDAELKERLARAAAGSDGSLRVSSLREENHRLRTLLIEVHARVEEDPRPAARDLEDRIWRELARSNERRSLSLAPI